MGACFCRLGRAENYERMWLDPGRNGWCSSGLLRGAIGLDVVARTDFSISSRHCTKRKARTTRFRRQKRKWLILEGECDRLQEKGRHNRVLLRPKEMRLRDVEMNSLFIALQVTYEMETCGKVKKDQRTI